MTGTGCASIQEINTAQPPVGGMNRHHSRYRLSSEIVPFSCPAIGALDNEYARLHDLRPIPAERTRLQYRDGLILFHLLPADCRRLVNMSHLAILGQKRRAPCKRGAAIRLRNARLRYRKHLDAHMPDNKPVWHDQQRQISIEVAALRYKLLTGDELGAEKLRRDLERDLQSKP